LLDIGTGAGCSLNIFPESWFVIGLDRSITMLKKSRKRGNNTCVVGDGYFPPVKNQSIEFVSAIGVTEYIRDKFGFLQVVRNTLHPSGFFLVTFSIPHLFNRLRIMLGSSLFFIPVEQWERLLAEAGFIQIEQKQSFFQIQYLCQLNSH
jgi:predicted TPR repeat methyltransferase